MDGFSDRFTTAPPVDCLIHPTAVIAPGAVIGRDVRIGPYCIVGANVVLGDEVHLVAHVVIDGITTLGEGVVVQPFASVGLPPQDVKYRDEPTRCEIGERTHIREHCSIHRGTPGGRGVTRVGKGCMLMAVAHVAHDCQIGDGVVIANNVVMGGHVTIGDHAVIGGSAALHQYITIGRGAMIGGMVGVPGDVVPFAMVSGQRAGWVAGLNVIGLRRRGYDRSAVHRLRAAFRTLFGRKASVAEQAREARALHGGDPLVAEVLDFMDQRGTRGLTPAQLSGAALSGASADMD